MLDWGSSRSKLLVSSLNIIDNACSALRCPPGCYLACSCNFLTTCTKSSDFLFVLSIGLSIGMLQCWGYKLYYPDILTPSCTRNWECYRYTYVVYCPGPAGLMYHASNAHVYQDPLVSGGLKMVPLVVGVPMAMGAY